MRYAISIFTFFTFYRLKIMRSPDPEKYKDSPTKTLDVKEDETENEGINLLHYMSWEDVYRLLKSGNK